MLTLISLRRSFIIFVIIELVQTRQVSWVGDEAIPLGIDQAYASNDENDKLDIAQTTVNKIDSIVERITDIVQNNEFDFTDEVFNIANDLQIPYVKEIKFIFSSLKRIKNKIKSPEVLRLMKHSFDYVKDSKLVEGIKSLPSVFKTCSPRVKSTYHNTTTNFNNIIYKCPLKVSTSTNFELKTININTKFHYQCEDINCIRQKIYSPVVIEFDEDKNLRLTIQSYYRLSRKPNFYAMLLQLYESSSSGHVVDFPNANENFFLHGRDISYLIGEMVDSCITSTYLKMYHMTFLESKQPDFAVPNQLEYSPNTRYYWFKGRHSIYHGHWKGGDYWTGGYPDKCMRDYVDFACPYFENCWL